MVKFTVYYNLNQGGWTETFYTGNTSIQLDIDTSSFWKDLWTKSLALRANGVVIYGCRQTVVGANPRRAFLSKFYDKFGNHSFADGTEPDVTATDALYYMYDDTLAIKRPVYLRGLPDNQIVKDKNGIDFVSSKLDKAVNRYIDAWKATGLVTNWQNKDNIAYPQVRVTRIAPSAVNANNSTLTLSPALTITAGQQVQFAKIPLNDIPGFPRIATVLSVTAGPPNTIDIPFRLRISGADGFYAPAQMLTRRLFNQGAAVSSIKFWQFSEHKAGRPFGQPVGRKRVTIRAR